MHRTTNYAFTYLGIGATKSYDEIVFDSVTTAETKESKNYITEISTNTFNVNKNNSNNNNLNTKSAQTGLYNNNWGSIISR